jgi:hypothetical protein
MCSIGDDVENTNDCVLLPSLQRKSFPCASRKSFGMVKENFFFLLFFQPLFFYSVTEQKVIRGIGRLRHVKSLDNLHQRNFRPGSKLEISDSLPDPVHNKHIARPFRILSIDGGQCGGEFRLEFVMVLFLQEE